MNTKLTLKLNDDVINKIKLYAKKHDISLSKMVENYFLALVTENASYNKKVSSLVKELSGVIELPESFDYRESYRDYLVNKYKQ